MALTYLLYYGVRCGSKHSIFLIAIGEQAGLKNHYVMSLKK